MSRIMGASHESFSGQPDSVRHGLGTIDDPELCDENDEQRKHASCLVAKRYDNRSTIPPR